MEPKRLRKTVLVYLGAVLLVKQNGTNSMRWHIWALCQCVCICKVTGNEEINIEIISYRPIVGNSNQMLQTTIKSLENIYE